MISLEGSDYLHSQSPHNFCNQGVSRCKSIENEDVDLKTAQQGDSL